MAVEHTDRGKMVKYAKDIIDSGFEGIKTGAPVSRGEFALYILRGKRTPKITKSAALVMKTAELINQNPKRKK